MLRESLMMILKELELPMLMPTFNGNAMDATEANVDVASVTRAKREAKPCS
jgi:hypothetical protein